MNRYLTIIFPTLGSLILVAAPMACTSTPNDRSVEEIEQEKQPLAETDCLEGEYFDKTTESCELLGTGSDIEAPPSDIDLPIEDTPETDGDPLEGSTDEPGL